jgi:manganese/zinc/iron transport system substrate-binding protein
MKKRSDRALQRWILFWLIFAVTAVPLWGKLRVVTTVGMITDVVREVGTERVEVVGLIGEGIDPHLFKPNRKALIELYEADAVIYNGSHLEGRMTEVLARLSDRGTPTLALAESILSTGRIAPLPGDYYADPHLWMDVAAWREGVFLIAEFLADVDPTEGGSYKKNAEHYAARLLELEAYGRAVLETVPQERRILITAHDAFSYFGRAFDYEVRGIQGISTDSESGLKELEALIDLIVERQIPAIFAESSVSQKNIRALREGASARQHTVAFGGTLYSDAMGAAGTYEGTYIGMLDHNYTTITRALGGDAPLGGMLGRLQKPK